MFNFQSIIISLVLRFCDQGKCMLRLGAIHFAVESYFLGIDYFVFVAAKLSSYIFLPCSGFTSV